MLGRLEFGWCLDKIGGRDKHCLGVGTGPSSSSGKTEGGVWLGLEEIGGARVLDTSLGIG
jgi:hypothetical protein